MFGIRAGFVQAGQRQAGALGVQLGFDAFGQAQGVHQELERQLFVGQFFRTGLALASLDEGRADAEQSGLMQVEPSRLAATDRGQLFLNDLLQKFLS